jgi:YegS/Rv2252/BmrU family lipid kinase
MDALVIVNPNAAAGGAGRTFGAVRTVMEHRLGPVEVVFTSGPGHAIELSRQAAQSGRTRIIAVGGDGTLHEVANGILDAGRATVLGYIGLGTGGDFRRTLGLDHRLDVYLEAIARGRERRVDAGRIRYRFMDGALETRWFLNIVSAGLGGLVDRRVANTTRALGSTAAYFLASVGALAACRRGRLRCSASLRGQPFERTMACYMIAVCNGRFFGSGMHVAPMAALDDGCFEVVSMDAPNKVAFAAVSRRIYDGAHLKGPGVAHFTCDKITIDLENTEIRDVFLLDVDGEPLGCLPLEIELVPQALRVIC